MTEAFGEAYAEAYDALYADKDYEAECDLVESLARRLGVHGNALLDLGCGTGQHALILARRGFHVTGIDVSTRMLAAARRRAEGAGVEHVEFLIGDVRTARVGGGPYDIALLMFAVLGYQLRVEDVRHTFETARSHLKDGGMLFLDVWNGPAVEAIGPTVRTKRVERDGHTIVRRARGTLDTYERLCTVDYELEWLQGGVVTKTASERHQMRYFFEPELREIAHTARFEVVETGAFPNLQEPADATQWNAGYVAIAR